MKRAQNNGTTVIATAYEAKSASTTVRANAENRNWLTPYRNVTGKNTTAVVSVAANTGRATSRPPFSAATCGVSPSSRCRKIFSSTTTELSINREKAKASPPKIIEFTELSPNERTMKVARAE